MKNFLLTALLAILSTGVALAVAEGVLRVKNSSMQNYDIEMWRYARELKKRSDNPLLGHEHVRSKSAALESVVIRINEWGLRGGPVPPSTPGKRRILFLGGSITLGWGVPEEETVTERLRRMFAADCQNVEMLNGGVGNYNADRYVELFLTKLTGLNPTDLVVHYFLRDAEMLDTGGGNAFLRNSQLAVTAWIAATRYLGKAHAMTLEEHYRAVYQPSSPGFQAMQGALKRLADYAAAHGIRLYLAMTPDVHDLTTYKFQFIHNLMQGIAAENGYVYIDLLPSLRNLTPEMIWALPGDPHPNGLGHQRMAEAIFPALRLATAPAVAITPTRRSVTCAF